MRPTGKLHLGNYVGALKNWVELQHTYECFFFIADWHALTTDFAETYQLADNTRQVLLDWLSAGLDPENCTMFVQSHVLQHAELHVLLSMITPLGELERVPSYKEQQQNLSTKNLNTYGFLGYPVLQAADILIYGADFVPVGEDQVAHVELTRDIARRFNTFFPKGGVSATLGGPFGSEPRSLRDKVLVEPQHLLTSTPKLLGTDGRKMSKSYGNSILLSEDPTRLAAKINNSVTDRPALTDRGNPDRCPVGNLHQIFSDPERLAYITKGCTTAGITCVECKALAIQSVNAYLEPIRERRRHLAQRHGYLEEIIQGGAKKAAFAAEETMVAAREAVGLLEKPPLIEPASERAGTIFLIPGVPQDTDFAPLRVPESFSSAQTEDERRQIRIEAWLERVTQNYLLRKDRPQLFITRRGRKVGIDAVEGHRGTWTFRLQDRPVNVLVLIAQDDDGTLHDYVLPPKIVQAYWKQFERKGKMVEIKLRRSADGAWLALTGGDVPIHVYQEERLALE